MLCLTFSLSALTIFLDAQQPPSACSHTKVAPSFMTRSAPPSRSRFPLQKTVPSEMISSGGPPPVSARSVLAISRPPFQVAASSTWAVVSSGAERCSRIAAAILSLEGRLRRDARDRRQRGGRRDERA
jgi:hypothetical protein